MNTLSRRRANTYSKGVGNNISWKKCAVTGAALLVCKQIVVDVTFLRTHVGMRPSDPLPVSGVKIRSLDVEQFIQEKRVEKRRLPEITNQNNTSRADMVNADGLPINIRLRAFDDLPAKDLALPRTWDLVLSHRGVKKEQLDANTCFPGGDFGGVNCLPSFFILGFEKCSTTALNIWLSYHPNLLTHWLERRFFDHLNNQRDLDAQWHSYLRKLPRIPGGISNVGRYWTFEKSPSYATSPLAPEMSAALVPNAKLLFMTRNPTPRAYSMFLMYTRHYPSVTNALRGQPVSFFIKNMATGDIRYVRDRALALDIQPGIGGHQVPQGLVPTNDEWRFLSFPPDPRDFDTWIRNALAQSKVPDFSDPSRPHRILFGGFYSAYLKRWLRYFSPEQFVLIPSEQFFTNSVLESFEKLQKLLGLPEFDYSTIASMNEKNNRIDIKSVAMLSNEYVNRYHRTPPMLNETKNLLDEFYCEQNRELSHMLGNRSLPGYSCAEVRVPSKSRDNEQ